MPTLTPSEIGRLLEPFLLNPPDAVLTGLSTYLDLLLKWNARTNLTAIRAPEEIVTRHFGESLFLGKQISSAATLLDYGSGAGFPGLPIALLFAEIRVTLAESQNKKVSFLREAVRTLDVPVEIWPRRVEEMPASARFDVVVLRAVDDMESAIVGAQLRATSEVLILTSRAAIADLCDPSGFSGDLPIPVPLSFDRVVHRLRRKLE